MRTNTPTVYTPGQTIEVVWKETVDHIGSYRIAFSPADDDKFDSNVLNTTGDEANVHDYKATITLPMQTCDACTLQLIQIMGTVATPTNQYYSCADIKIVADTGGSTPPPPVPTDVKQFAQQLLDGFKTADKDSDSALSFAEVQAIYSGVTTAQFNALDVTKDGLLSAADLDAVINPPPPVSNPGPSTGGTGSTTTQDEKTTTGSFDWSLLLLLAAYFLTLRDRRRTPRPYSHLPRYDIVSPLRRDAKHQ